MTIKIKGSTKLGKSLKTVRFSKDDSILALVVTKKKFKEVTALCRYCKNSIKVSKMEEHLLKKHRIVNASHPLFFGKLKFAGTKKGSNDEVIFRRFKKDSTQNL